MCFFKKKKPVYPANAKWQKGQLVNFRYRDDLWFGWIWDAFVEDDKIIYTIQIGGQCPSFVYKIPEETILSLKKR